ncbi:MAG: homoserine O-succinyltransferase [Acidobacteriota bacterium]
MSAVEITAGTGLYHLPLEFPLEHGGALRSGLLAFELTGPPDAPLVVVQGGISAGRHVTATSLDPSPGWWQGVVGPERAIDTDRCRVLSTDWLGGIGASSGPARGADSSSEFPIVSSQDQARALLALLDDLGIETIDRFVGASYGGMVGLAFAALTPKRLRGVTAISAAHESHPHASAWRSIQRRIVELGSRHGEGPEALELARGLALTTYRSRRELAERFTDPPTVLEGRARFAVESYLEARGRDFASRFFPEAFLSLSLAIDLHRVEPEKISSPVTLVAATSDELVPVEQIRDLAGRIAGPVRLIEIDTRYGHDAFLKEEETIGAIVRSDLAEVAR